MLLERTEGKYYLNGEEVGPDGLLDRIRTLDDELGGRFTLTGEENEELRKLFAGYHPLPDFTSLVLMEASSGLFSYLAREKDASLAARVASAMGWQTDAGQLERIRTTSQRSGAYREYWMDLARNVLTADGFDDYRFGSVKSPGNGTYLYDGEKAVCYVEVSRQGDERRSAVISLTLLGNPEAIEDEEGNRGFEWCCFFDDELSRYGDGAMILGGRLRTIDPFGSSSRLHRRYDLVYDPIEAGQLALVLISLVRMLESYPPEAVE